MNLLTNISKNLFKKQASRIQNIANDLKRPLDILAKELNFDNRKLQQLIKGNGCKDDYRYIIDSIYNKYPIALSDLYVEENDTKDGIIFYNKDKSSRIVQRINENNQLSDFYEYSDTVMSRIGPFKPELIKMLRVVNNNDSYNPNAIYNKGHFLAQTTFFIGPVNFYYEIDNKKYCKEMNTGDSVFITPYVPHTFTNRDNTKEAKIFYR